MAKKTLLSESQVSNFMKLANIKSDKINGFKKRLNENYGMGGTVPMPSMAEDEEAADAGPSDEGDDMGTGMEAPEMDTEPDAPAGDLEADPSDFKEFLRDALKEVLPQVMAELEGGGEEEMDMGEMDLESDEMTSDEEGMDMEDEGDEELDMEEEDEGEEEEEEEQELQEAKKKAMKADKKTRNLEGGDAKKKMKESLAFDNVDLVTDDEIINEVLKRVIRRIV